MQLSNYLFRAPRATLIIPLIFICSLILGILSHPLYQGISFNEDRLPMWILSVTGFVFESMAIYFIPALITILITTFIPILTGEDFRLGRWSFLALSSMVIMMAAMGLGRALMVIVPYPIIYLVIFAYSIVFGFRYIFLSGVVRSGMTVVVPLAAFHTIVGQAAVFGITPVFVEAPWFIAAVGLNCIVFLSYWGFFKILAAPMVRNFKFNPLHLARLTFLQFSTTDPRGKAELEKFFEHFGEPLDIHIGLLAFKRKNRIRALVIIPTAHPGPFGILGGSNLPRRLQEWLNDESDHVVVLHGACTHDENPISSRECRKLASAVRKGLKDLKYENRAGAFIRQTQPDNSLTVCAQPLGNGLLLSHTSAPEPTDDIEYSVGYSAMITAKKHGWEDAVFADAHNCLVPGTGNIFFGSERAYQLLTLADEVAREAKTQPMGAVKMGYAQYTPPQKMDDLGEMGIQVIVLVTEQQRVALIVFDGNNIIRSLRERLLTAISELVDEAEIFTSDNHSVNMTIGGYNPVGLKTDYEWLEDKIVELVITALEDLAPTTIGMTHYYAKNFRVFGPQTLSRLSATINATVSIMLKTMIMVSLIAVLSAGLLYQLLVRLFF